ncbi:MAG: PAS domain S-box protein [Ignavibacteriales bacterium]
MPKHRSGSDGKEVLRHRAERLVPERDILVRPDNLHDMEKLLHELSVSKHELEMHNKQLRRLQKRERLLHEKYFKLYNFAPSGYITISNDHIITEVNSTAASMLGAEIKWLSGKSVTDFIDPPFLDIFHFHASEAYKTGKKQECELRLVRTDGIRFYAFLNSMVLNENEREPHLCMALTDISDRKAAELDVQAGELRKRNIELSILTESLQAERERLMYQAHLIDNVNDAIIATDGRYTLTAWNKAAERMYGWKAEEVLGKDIRGVISTEYGSKKNAGMTHVFDDMGRVSERLVQFGKDDKKVVTECTTIAIRDKNGEVTGYISVNRDITEHKKAEKALRISTERFRLAVDNFPDTFIIYDAERRIQFINAYGIRTGGYSMKHYIGYKDEEIYPPEVTNAYLPTLKNCVTTRTPQTVECRLRYPSGILTTIINYVPLLNEKGKIYQILGIMHDITKRKQAEEKLQRTITELKRSNEELEQFAYIASHDMQEPLRMIASYTQLLAKRYSDQLDSSALDFINYALEGAKRMQRLINDLLKYSRVTTRGKPFKSIDCEAILTDVLSDLKESILENKATITQDPLPMILADETQIAQLLQNLIGNAIKFHGERDPEIHISCQRKDKSWVFSIRDNGIGMESEYFNRIFLIFQRLHTKEAYPGTGIGLAVCKKIVERHGGRIWVESTPGEGSIFYFTIPAKRGKLTNGKF